MRIAIISDIHSNLAALEAVLADAGNFEEIWCLGDIVGYGPDPNECIDMIRRYPHIAVAGNHDWAAVGLVETVYFNPDAAAACLWTGQQLTMKNKEYLRNLPVTLEREESTLVHGSPRDPIWEYLLDEEQANANLRYFHTKHCLIGHSHIPLVFSYGDEDKNGECQMIDLPISGRLDLTRTQLIINPGSVGQPRDGNPAASYAILDVERRMLRFRRVYYDTRKTQEKMRLLGLPPRLAARLSFGL
ncbi:MAG: metallophosphatase family protein [Chloroflexi bacterium]|nr:metallophosphatase family protein [Chloroflexota bacterium]MCL5075625.1 metallophosphatase family protein [Chloroflexota bacterium]